MIQRSSYMGPWCGPLLLSIGACEVGPPALYAVGDGMVSNSKKDSQLGAILRDRRTYVGIPVGHKTTRILHSASPP